VVKVVESPPLSEFSLTDEGPWKTTASCSSRFWGGNRPYGKRRHVGSRGFSVDHVAAQILARPAIVHEESPDLGIYISIQGAIII
jgi:hypothetical protein